MWWFYFVRCSEDKGVGAYAQSCPIPCNPINCSPPGSSVHGVSQARILGWVALPSSRGSSRPRDQTQGLNPHLLPLMVGSLQLSHLRSHREGYQAPIPSFSSSGLLLVWSWTSPEASSDRVVKGESVPAWADSRLEQETENNSVALALPAFYSNTPLGRASFISFKLPFAHLVYILKISDESDIPIIVRMPCTLWVHKNQNLQQFC